MDRSQDEIPNSNGENINDVSSRRKALVGDIRRYSPKYESQPVENILLVGRSGVGKSGVMNTIAKVVNGEYFPVARMGTGKEQTRSLELLVYRNCGARTDVSLLEEKEEESLRGLWKTLPNIIDFAGLGDTDDPQLTEIFDLQIKGFIPPGTAYQALERDQERYGSLKGLYNISKPEWMISKVVFVHSCTDTIPMSLITCLLRALRTVDDNTITLRYTGDVFLLITRYDLVEPMYALEPRDPERKTVSMKEFKTIERTLANLFNIEGSLEYNRLRWVNYCSDTGYNNQNIDIIVLEFLKQMLIPTVPSDFPRPKIPWFRKLLSETMLYWRARINLAPRESKGMFIIVVLVILVAWLLTRGVKPS